MVKLLKTNNLSSILILFIVKSYARNNILKNISYIVQGKCTITTLSLKYKILAACYLTISQEKQKTYKNNLKTNLNGSNISSNMHNLLCWTKCWIRLNSPISPNISQKNKKIMLHGVGGKFFQNNFFMQHFLASKTKNAC